MGLPACIPAARRAILSGAALALASCAADGVAGAEVAPPHPDDCVLVEVWSNGFHTNLALPGEAFPPGHPLRAAFPDEDYFLIGFGERDYYLADDPGPAAAIRAASSPRPGVLHVVASDQPITERLWRPTEVRTVAVSREGLAAIAEGIGRSLDLAPSAEGGALAPVVVAEGKAPRSADGGSLFLASTESFHLFHMCNHWTAERLAAAGVDVAPGGMFRADALMQAVGREAPAACPSGGSG